MGDTKLLETVYQLFLKTENECIVEIEKAFASEDREALIQWVHRLAGSIANFTRNGPFQTAKTLETFIRDDGDTALAQKKYVRLQSELREFLVELETFRKSVA